jgi:hypothetical protein
VRVSNHEIQVAILWCNVIFTFHTNLRYPFRVISVHVTKSPKLIDCRQLK